MTASDRLLPALDAARTRHAEAPADRSAVHLAEYAFRFDTQAAPVRDVVVRPLPDAEWTLAQTLQEIRLRRVDLSVASTGLKVRHGHRLPGLVRNAARHADALCIWTRLGGHAAPEAPGWDDETRLYAGWYLRLFEAPAVGFALAPGVTVTDAARHRASVLARLEQGPEAPGAEGLQADLAALFTRYASASVPRVRALRDFARAA